jgi:hypothetical protein
MDRDIDRIIERVKERQPTVLAEQLAPSHPGTDEDGLWFFRLPGTPGEVAVDSATGDCPFVIEHDDMRSSAEAETVASVDEAVEKVAAYLATQSAATGAAAQSPGVN